MEVVRLVPQNRHFSSLVYFLQHFSTSPASRSVIMYNGHFMFFYLNTAQKKTPCAIAGRSICTSSDKMQNTVTTPLSRVKVIVCWLSDCSNLLDIPFSGQAFGMDLNSQLMFVHHYQRHGLLFSAGLNRRFVWNFNMSLTHASSVSSSRQPKLRVDDCNPLSWAY
jgi:hypothetical protein